MELHAKTALEKQQQLLTEVDDSQLSSALEQVLKAERRLKTITDLRRKSMRIISTYAEELNPEMWCEVKHSAMAMYTAFEVYQAEETTELYDFYIENNQLFIETMSDFLGFDIPPCASCFSDRLKGA